MIFNLIVAGMGFVVATFDGLRTYHRKSIQSLVSTLNHCICITMLILDYNPIWYPLVLFVLYGFMLFLVIEDAHRVVHGEVGKQKLWNTLRGWYYLSIANIYGFFNSNKGYWFDEWSEDVWIKGYAYSLYGYYPPKTVSWEDAKREFGLDIDDELDDNEDVD